METRSDLGCVMPDLPKVPMVRRPCECPRMELACDIFHFFVVVVVVDVDKTLLPSRTN